MIGQLSFRQRVSQTRKPAGYWTVSSDGATPPLFSFFTCPTLARLVEGFACEKKELIAYCKPSSPFLGGPADLPRDWEIPLPFTFSCEPPKTPTRTPPPGSEKSARRKLTPFDKVGKMAGRKRLSSVQGVGVAKHPQVLQTVFPALLFT